LASNLLQQLPARQIPDQLLGSPRVSVFRATSASFNAPHRRPHQRGQPANLRVRDRPVSPNRLNQFVPQNHTQIVSLRGAVLGKPRLPGTQEQMPRCKLMDGGGKRDHEHRGGSRMMVPPIWRDDDDGAPRLAGRVSGELGPPDLPPRRVPFRRGLQCLTPAKTLGPTCFAHSVSSDNCSSDTES